MRYTGAVRTAGTPTGRLFGKAGGALCLSAAIALGSCTVASADPVAPNQLSADRLPSELTAALARDLSMTPQQYLDRSADAQKLGRYAARFRVEHPADFAGAWIGDDGIPVVAVTTTAAAGLVARDGYRAQQAPFSAASLEQSLADFTAWVSTLPREVSSQINSAAIDFLNNRIVVDIANSDIGRILKLPTVIVNLQVLLSPPTPDQVGPDAMGGDTYVTSNSPIATAPLTDIGVCSFGFNALSAAGDPINISAGHCNPNNASGAGGAKVFLPDYGDVHRSSPIGEFVESSVGASDGLDYSEISLDDAGIAAGLDQPTVRGSGGGVLEITGTAEPVVGAPVCKSGQASSFTCGTVSAVNVQTQLYMEDGSSRSINGFASTACTLSGDSGGAIVTGTLALGITSGSNSGGAPSCRDADAALAQYGGTASLGIPIGRITDATGASVRTS